MLHSSSCSYSCFCSDCDSPHQTNSSWSSPLAARCCIPPLVLILVSAPTATLLIRRTQVGPPPSLLDVAFLLLFLFLFLLRLRLSSSDELKLVLPPRCSMLHSSSCSYSCFCSDCDSPHQTNSSWSS